MRRNLVIIAGACVLAGCFEGAVPAFSAASSTITTSEDGRRLYVASVEDDAVVLVDHDARTSRRVYEGGGPTRIARTSDRVLFTLSEDDRIGFATDSEDGLTDLATLEIAGSPFGVVIEPSGERAYVSSPISGRVDEIDLVQRTVARSFEVEGDPSWLALHPASEMLYVGGAARGVWASIDLHSDQVTQHELPSWVLQHHVVVDGGVAVHEYELVPRLTGDPAVTGDGGALLFPAIYEPHLVGETETATGADLLPQPALVVVPLGTDGSPLIARQRVTGTHPYFLAGLRGLEPLSFTGGRPSSVVVAPGSSFALVTQGPAAHSPSSAHVVVAVPIREASSHVSALSGSGNGSSSAPGTYEAGTLAIPGARPGLIGSLSVPESVPFAIQGDFGLRGITFSNASSAWIHAALDRSVSRLDTHAIESALYDLDPAARHRAIRSIVLEPPIGF